MKSEVIIELLREQIKDAEQELENIRNSLRYRLGETLLQMSPLSLRSTRVLPKLWRLYKSRRSGPSRPASVSRSPEQVPQAALIATELGLGVDLEVGGGGWTTEETELMALRMRANAPILSIVLRRLSVSVVRQLARVQQGGARIVWWPDPEIEHPPALEAYVSALADECRAGRSV